jgi:hypothetical protein
MEGPRSVTEGSSKPIPYKDGNFGLFRAGRDLGTSNRVYLFEHTRNGWSRDDGSGRGGVMVIEEVAPFLKAMFDQCESDLGYRYRLRLRSGLRTREEQAYLYNNYQQTNAYEAAVKAKNPTFTFKKYNELNEHIDTVTMDTATARNPGQPLTAKPGYSNHQSGIAFDIHYGQTEAERGKQYVWLCKNAWRFGFVRTVFSERWHWEYRGNWGAGGPSRADTSPGGVTYPMNQEFMNCPEGYANIGTGGKKSPFRLKERYGVSSMFKHIPRYHKAGVTARRAAKRQAAYDSEVEKNPEYFLRFSRDSDGAWQRNMTDFDFLWLTAKDDYRIGQDPDALERNSKVLKSSNWWTRWGAPANHPDKDLGGMVNTWIGHIGVNLPDLFDIIDPTWTDPGSPTWGDLWAGMTHMGDVWGIGGGESEGF